MEPQVPGSPSREPVPQPAPLTQAELEALKSLEDLDTSPGVTRAALKAIEPQKPESLIISKMTYTYKGGFKNKASNLIHKLSGGLFGKTEQQRVHLEDLKSRHLRLRLARDNFTFWAQQVTFHSLTPYKPYYESKLESARRELEHLSKEIKENKELCALSESVGTLKLNQLTEDLYRINNQELADFQNSLLATLDNHQSDLIKHYADIRVAQERIKSLVDLVSTNKDSPFIKIYKDLLNKAIENRRKAEAPVRNNQFFNNTAIYRSLDERLENIPHYTSGIENTKQEIENLKSSANTVESQYVSLKVAQKQVKILDSLIAKGTPLRPIYQEMRQELLRAIEDKKQFFKDDAFYNQVADVASSEEEIPQRLEKATQKQVKAGIDGFEKRLLEEEAETVKAYTDYQTKLMISKELANFAVKHADSPFLDTYQNTQALAAGNLAESKKVMVANPHFQWGLENPAPASVEAMLIELETQTAPQIAKSKESLQSALNDTEKREQAALNKVLALRVAYEELAYLKALPLDLSNSSKEFQMKLRDKIVTATTTSLECKRAVENDQFLRSTPISDISKKLMKATDESFANAVKAKEEPRKQEIDQEKAKRVQEVMEQSIFKNAVAKFKSALQINPLSKASINDYLPPEYQLDNDQQKTVEDKVREGQVLTQNEVIQRNDEKLMTPKVYPKEVLAGIAGQAAKPAASKDYSKMPQKQLKETLRQLTESKYYQARLLEKATEELSENKEGAQDKVEEHQANITKLEQEIAAVEPFVVKAADKEAVSVQLKATELTDEQRQKQIKDQIKQLSQQREAMADFLKSAEYIPLAVVAGRMSPEDAAAKSAKAVTLPKEIEEMDKKITELKAKLSPEPPSSVTAPKTPLKAPVMTPEIAQKKLRQEILETESRMKTIERNLKTYTEAHEQGNLETEELLELGVKIDNATKALTQLREQKQSLQKQVNPVSTVSAAPESLPAEEEQSTWVAKDKAFRNTLPNIEDMALLETLLLEKQAELKKAQEDFTSADALVQARDLPETIALIEQRIEEAQKADEKSSQQIADTKAKLDKLEAQLFSFDLDAIKTKSDANAALNSLVNVPKDFEELHNDFDVLDSEHPEYNPLPKKYDSLQIDRDLLLNELQHLKNELPDASDILPAPAPSKTLEEKKIALVHRAEARYEKEVKEYNLFAKGLKEKYEKVSERLSIELNPEEVASSITTVQSLIQAQKDDRYGKLLGQQFFIREKLQELNLEDNLTVEVYNELSKVENLGKVVRELNYKRSNKDEDELQSSLAADLAPHIRDATNAVFGQLIKPNDAAEVIEFPAGISEETAQNYVDSIVATLLNQYARDQLPEETVKDDPRALIAWADLKASEEKRDIAQAKLQSDNSLIVLSQDTKAVQQLNQAAYAKAYRQLIQNNPLMAEYLKNKTAERMAALIIARADFEDIKEKSEKLTDNTALSVPYHRIYKNNEAILTKAAMTLNGDVYYNAAFNNDLADPVRRTEFEAKVNAEVKSTQALRKLTVEYGQIKNMQKPEELESLKAQKIQQRDALRAAEPRSTFIKDLDDVIAYIDKRITKLAQSPTLTSTSVEDVIKTTTIPQEGTEVIQQHEAEAALRANESLLRQRIKDFDKEAEILLKRINAKEVTNVTTEWIAFKPRVDSIRKLTENIKTIRAEFVQKGYKFDDSPIPTVNRAIVKQIQTKRDELKRKT